MNTEKLKIATFSLLAWFLPASLFAGTAPSVTPAGDQEVLIANDGSKLAFNATGGDCDPPADPNSTCNWTKDGSPSFVWLYSTLSGSPAPAGTGASLSLDKDKEGKTDVGAQVQQKWKDAKGNPATTNSPTSNPIKVAIQKPTSLVFDSAAPAGPAGGSFKWKLMDGSGSPIKNLTCELTETYSGITTFTNGIPVANFLPVSGVATRNTDAAGIFNDTPVGMTETSLKNTANTYRMGFVATTVETKTYNDVVLPDGRTFSVTKQSTQTVTQEATPYTINGQYSFATIDTTAASQ